MAMLTLNGVVQNVFRTESSTDKKTGEIRPAKDRIQILAENVLPNGQKRIELVTLSVEDPEPYRKLLGRAVRVPVGAFVSGSAVQFYALKGSGSEAPQASRRGAPARGGRRRQAGGAEPPLYLIHRTKAWEPATTRVSGG